MHGESNRVPRKPATVELSVPRPSSRNTPHHLQEHLDHTGWRRRTKLKGDLAIHGVTQQVVLKVEVSWADTKDPCGKARIGASATTRIKRSDFGLTWNAALETGGLLVGDNVRIELEVSLIRS